MAPARKATKKAPKAAAKKKPARKKAGSGKASGRATKKKASAKAPKKAGPAKKKAAVAKNQAPAKKAPQKARKKKARKARPRVVGAPASGERRSKLGSKYTCFDCGAKFYDLNQPEPICPRCGADQRERPDEPRPSPPPAPRTRAARPLAPLLDDDDAATTRRDELSSDELDVEISGLDDDEGGLSEAGLDLAEDAEIDDDED